MSLKKVAFMILASILISLSPAICDAPAPEDAAPVQRTILQRADIPGTGLELIYALVEVTADSIPPHKLDYVMIGEIIEGDYWIRIGDEPRRLLHPGDTLIIPGGALHQEGAIGKTVKVKAAYVNAKGATLVNPQK